MRLHGYAATGIKDITVKFLKGSFYNHFKSKEGIPTFAYSAY